MKIDSQLNVRIRDITGVDQQSYDPDIVPRMLGIVKSLKMSCEYSDIGKLRKVFFVLNKTQGYQAVEAAARALLVEMTAPDYWTPVIHVPDSVRKQIFRQRKRVIREATEEPLGYYNPFHEAFLKDFSLLRGKSMPVNTGIVDTQTALWRRPLIVGPLSQRLKFVELLIRAPAGTRYFFNHHTHNRMLMNFNQQGRLRTYEQVCDLLEINSDYKGFISGSWYNDPALESISPRLTYLARDPMNSGAYRFYAGPDNTGNALVKSRTRNELYQKGKYVPSSYMVVWHRDEMLKWREKRK